MDVFDGQQWRHGCLDAWCGPTDCRIAVEHTLVLGPVRGAYFVQPRDLRRVVNYLREIGPRDVVRKIVSRRRESARNEKFLTLVAGTVLHAPIGGPRPGTAVLAICPLHPRASERVVVDAGLVRPRTEMPALLDGAPVGVVATATCAVEPAPGSALDTLSGWHPASGRALFEGVMDTAWAQVATLAAGAGAWQTHATGTSPVAERHGDAPRTADQRRVVLFGYGQYAKTIVLPNLDARLHLAAIHEVDPAQLATSRGVAAVLDTSPWPRADDRYDVYFAAGYHHTHASIALHALAHGASAIVEKPPVTTHAQLDALLQAWRGSTGHVYVCFQRRHAPFSAMARADLADGADAGANASEHPSPVSYRCLVYEVPLPPRHWYRWPASQGRVVSNGCHWIDHFLWMNAYVPVTRFDAWTAHNGDSVCMAELRNGASFSMALTDRGSDCIGMQNTIELRSEYASVRIVNDSDYRAEGRRGVIRRARRNKMHAFADMYRAISAAAVEGRALDTPDSLEASARLMLSLDALVRGAGPDDAG